MSVDAALTAEEWADLPRYGVVAMGMRLDEHGIAAANLHGQPFGFTWERLESLGRVIDDAERWQAEHGWTGRYATEADLDNARADRDRIEALLPPEED